MRIEKSLLAFLFDQRGDEERWMKGNAAMVIVFRDSGRVK